MTTKKYMKVTGKFKVVDSNGLTDTVTEYTEMSEITYVDNSTHTLAGMKTNKLSNGDHVNANDDGTYLDVRRNRILKLS